MTRYYRHAGVAVFLCFTFLFVAMASSVAAEAGKVNINTATVKELQKLNGVGEATAKKIVEYREKNGAFMAVEGIKKVSGIGEETFKKIKDSITVGSTEDITEAVE